jgi:hypothetical protein
MSNPIFDQKVVCLVGVYEELDILAELESFLTEEGATNDFEEWTKLVVVFVSKN